MALPSALEKVLQLVGLIIKTSSRRPRLKGLCKSHKESETVTGFLSVLLAFVMEIAEQFSLTLARSRNYSERSVASGSKC